MKLRVGDQVRVTAGKDKGKEAKVVRVIPAHNQVVVEGMNMYARHVKPYGDRAGEITRRERPLDAGKVAIINDKGQIDRVGYQVGRDGKKQRVYKKTGTVIAVQKAAAKSTKPAKSEKSTETKKKTTKKK